MERSGIHSAVFSDIGHLVEQNRRELTMVEGNLVSAAGGTAPRTLMVTSCHPGDGKTVVAAALAAALAGTAHNRVLLVDGHLERPALHRHMGVAAAPGLADVVQGDARLGTAVRRSAQPNLFILPPGGNGPQTASALRAPRLPAVLARLRDAFDYVVLDGAPYLEHADTPFIARLFDGVILVIACEQTRWEVAQLVKGRIETVGGRLLGVVMNRRRYYIPRSLYRFL